MDHEKQPGIRIEGIILKESHFVRQPLIPDGVTLDLAFRTNNSFNEQERLIVELECAVACTGGAVEARTAFVGIFARSPESNMTLQEYAKSGAPAATLMPYIREELHSRFVKSGLPQLGVLPPINIHAMQQSLKPPVDAGKGQAAAKKKRVRK